MIIAPYKVIKFFHLVPSVAGIVQVEPAPCKQETWVVEFADEQAELRQALFFESFTSCCYGLITNLASLLLPEHDVPFHYLTYSASFDSFLDDHSLMSSRYSCSV